MCLTSLHFLVMMQLLTAGFSSPLRRWYAASCESHDAGEEAAPMFSDGMCKDCYVEYVRVVGGHDGKGMNPPAYISVEGTEGTLVDFLSNRK